MTDNKKPTRRTVTMKDVAKAAGVSMMTVSRAFKTDASVSSATRDQIRQVAEDLGYVLDSTASNLRSQRSGFVAVTIPSLNNANFADTVSALSTALGAAGMQVLLGYTNYDIREEERLIEQLLQRKPEAIVVTGGRHTPRAEKLLRGAGIPVIETWDLPDAPIGHVVGFSNAAAVQGMVDHFVARGLTRIAFGFQRRILDQSAYSALRLACQVLCYTFDLFTFHDGFVPSCDRLWVNSTGLGR